MFEIGIDYGFFGYDRDGVLPILRVKRQDSSIRCVGATVVDKKGASVEASSLLTAFIKRVGFKRILVRTDIVEMGGQDERAETNNLDEKTYFHPCRRRID